MGSQREWPKLASGKDQAPSSKWVISRLFPPVSDHEWTSLEVRFVPKTEVLFDYMIGAQHKTGRNFVTDRLRGL